MAAPETPHRIEGLDAYQEAARRTGAKNNFESEGARLACWGLGLTGEAGEFADLVKKHLFHGRPLVLEKAAKELGDTLWYLAMAADALGLSLSEVATLNIEKLRARYPDGFSHAASAARVDEVAR